MGLFWASALCNRLQTLMCERYSQQWIFIWKTFTLRRLLSGIKLIMFNKIHDKNQQDDPSGNGTCHQTSQPESNLLNPHGSRKRKQTPVLDLSSDLHKLTHTQQRAHTDTHEQAHVHSHTRTEVSADVNKIDSRYWYLSTIYHKLFQLSKCYFQTAIAKY